MKKETKEELFHFVKGTALGLGLVVFTLALLIALVLGDKWLHETLGKEKTHRIE